MIHAKETTMIFPENDEEFVAFLEPKLIGEGLPDLVDKLRHRPRLREVLGASRRDVLAEGLRKAASLAELRQYLLRNPRGLYSLQELICTRGGSYWDSVVDVRGPVRAAPTVDNRACLAASIPPVPPRLDEPDVQPRAISISENPEARRRGWRSLSGGWFAPVGLAASVLLLIAAGWLSALNRSWFWTMPQGIEVAMTQQRAEEFIKKEAPLSHREWMPLRQIKLAHHSPSRVGNSWAEDPPDTTEFVFSDYNPDAIAAAESAETAIGDSQNAKLEQADYSTAILWASYAFRLCGVKGFEDEKDNHEFRSRIELLKRSYGERAETSYLDGRFNLAVGEVMLSRLELEPAARFFQKAADQSLAATRLDQSYLKAKNNHAWSLYRLAELEAARGEPELAREHAVEASRAAYETLAQVIKEPLPERMATFAEYVDTFQKIATWRLEHDPKARKQAQVEIADAIHRLRPLKLDDPEQRSKVVVAESVPKLMRAMDLLWAGVPEPASK